MAQNSLNSIAEKADYCSYIDGWRGVAILLVLMVHSSIFAGNDGSGTFLFPFTERLFNSGARGVQLFYILSAFTLFNSSYRRFKTDLHPRRNFYLRRAFRILPLWFIAVAVFCFLSHKPWWVAGINASFLFGFFRFAKWLELVPGGWSLFVEETFYLMLPIIFGKITSLRKASNYTVILLLLAAAWSSLPYFKAPIPNTNAFFFLFPLNHWYIFGIGIMLYYIINDRHMQAAVSADNLKGRLDLIAFAMMPVIVVTYLSVISAMFAVCVFVSSIPGTLLNRIMNWSLLRRFGVYCYSIYLLHFLILKYSIPYIKKVLTMVGLQYAPVDVQFCLVFPMVAALALVVGYVSFTVIERPSVQCGKRVIDLMGLGGKRTEAVAKVAES